MGNSLGRTIQQGEVVVIKDKILALHAITRLKGDLRFVCNGGFGMSHVTVGTALMGHWLAEPPEVDGKFDYSRHFRMEGFDIDRDETLRFQLDPDKWLEGLERRYEKMFQRKQTIEVKRFKKKLPQKPSGKAKY